MTPAGRTACPRPATRTTPGSSTSSTTLRPDGRAGFVMANGSLTTMTGGEGKIRENLVRADVVDCIVALPAQLFYTTGIPVCLWFLDRDKASSGERDRRGEILFIDARQMGRKISRTQIELTDEEIERSPRPTTLARAHRRRTTRTRRDSARAPLWRRSRLPASRSRPAATSAPRVRGGRDRVRGADGDTRGRLADEMAENERLAGEVKAALGTGWI